MLEKNVINNYPYPIALTYKKIVDLPNSADSVEVKHQLLGNLFEVIIRYLTSIAISQYTMEKQSDNTINDMLSTLNERSSGLDHWNNVLKEILKFYKSGNKKFLMPELVALYFDKQREGFINIKRAYKELNIILKSGGERDVRQVSLNDFFPRLLDYHYTFWENKYANLTKKQLKKRVVLLEPAAEDFIEELEFLINYKLVYVVSEDKLRKTNKYNVQTYMGYKLPAATQSVRSLKKLEDKKLYLCDFKKVVPLLNLYPYSIVEYCAPCATGQVFFLRENKGAELFYISAQCGHDYSPPRYIKDLTGDGEKEVISSGQEESSQEGAGHLPSSSKNQNEMTYRTALEMALLDGPLSLNKQEKLKFYRDKFNIDAERAEELLKEAESRVVKAVDDTKKGELSSIIPNRISVPTSLIYKQYPYPVAYNYWQLNQGSYNSNLLLKYVSNTLSNILTYFSSVLVTQYIRDHIDDINLNIVLERLVEPSLEEWLLFMEEILRVYHDEDEKLIIGDLYKYYFSKQPGWEACLKAYKEISNDDFFLFKGNPDLKVITPAEFFKVIPDFVETLDYHSDDLSINQIKRLLALMVPAVDEIMVSLKFLVALKLFYVKKASYVKGKAKHEILDCMGAVAFEESEYLSKDYFTQDRIYIRSTVDKNFPVLNLSPFFVFAEHPKGSERKLFFYQKVTGDGNLEYFNYKNDVKFISQEYTRDLIKAFRKFTSEKKVNLVIKLLDWQKEKRKRDAGKRTKRMAGKGALEGKYEERKLHEEAKKASELKKQLRNSYRYALEAAWCDGILSEDERVYLDELKNILEISNQEVKVIEKSTEAKFAIKIDRAGTDAKKSTELEQHLEFLEEEHQMLLKSLEERRQQIRILGKSLKSLYEEKDICKITAEKAEKEKLEKERENNQLKKLAKELKSRLENLEKDTSSQEEQKKFEKQIKELESAKKFRDKKLEKVGAEFSKLTENMKSLKKDLIETKNKLSSVLKEKENLEKNLEEKLELETHLDSIVEDKVKQEQDLASLNKKKDALLKLVQELKKKLEQTGKAKALLEQKNKELISLNEELEDDNNEKRLLLKQKNKDIISLQQDIQTGNEERDALLVLIGDLKEKLVNTDRALMENEDKVKVMEELENRLSSVEMENRELMASNEKQANKIREAFGQLKSVREEKNALEEKIAHLEKEKDGEEKKVARLEKAKKKIEAKLEKLLKEFATAKNLVAQAKSRVVDFDKIKTEREELLKNKKELEDEVEDLAGKLVSSDNHILQLEDKLKESEGDREQIEFVKSSLEEQLMEAERLVLEGAEFKEKYDSLLEKVALLEAERIELINNNEKQKNKIIEIIKNSSEAKEEYNNMVSLKNSIEEERDGLLLLNQELQERIGNVREEMAYNEEEISELKDYRTRAEALDKEKDFLFKSLESKTNKIKELEDKLGKVISVSEKIKEKYNLLLQVKDKYEKEIKELKDKFSKSEEKYSELEKAQSEKEKPVGPDNYSLEKLRIMNKKLKDFEDKEKKRLKEERRRKKLEVKRKAEELRKQKEEWERIKDEKEELKKSREELQARVIADIDGDDKGFKEKLIQEKADLIMFREELEKKKKDIEQKKVKILEEVNKRQSELKEKAKELKNVKEKFERQKKAFESEKKRFEKSKSEIEIVRERKEEKQDLQALEEKLNILEKEKAELQALSSSEKEEHKLLIEKLKEEQETLKSELEEKQTVLESLEKEMEEERVNYEKEIEGKKKQLEDARLELIRERDELKAEREELKKEKTLMSDVSEDEQKKKDVDDSWDELVRERDALDEERKAIEEEITHFHEEQEASRKEICDSWDELSREREAVEEERKAVEEERKAVEEERKAIEEERKSAEVEEKALSSESGTDDTGKP